MINETQKIQNRIEGMSLQQRVQYISAATKRSALLSPKYREALQSAREELEITLGEGNRSDGMVMYALSDLTYFFKGVQPKPTSFYQEIAKKMEENKYCLGIRSKPLYHQPVINALAENWEMAGRYYARMQNPTLGIDAFKRAGRRKPDVAYKKTREKMDADYARFVHSICPLREACM